MTNKSGVGWDFLSWRQKPTQIRRSLFDCLSELTFCLFQSGFPPGLLILKLSLSDDVKVKTQLQVRKLEQMQFADLNARHQSPALALDVIMQGLPLFCFRI